MIFNGKILLYFFNFLTYEHDNLHRIGYSLAIHSKNRIGPGPVLLNVAAAEVCPSYCTSLLRATGWIKLFRHCIRVHQRNGLERNIANYSSQRRNRAIRPQTFTSASFAELVMPALNITAIPSNPLEIPAPSSTLLDAILELPQVRIRDQAVVARKLARLTGDGAEKFMVISDFDYTLSRCEDDKGNRHWTTHGVFDNFGGTVDPSLGEKLTALKSKYFPIEFCPQLTMEEKIPHMEAWWSQSHDYIVQAGFQKSMVEDFVRRSNIALREKCMQLFSELENNKVPLIIFSAGIGNVIEFYLQQQLNKIPSNVHIISNMMYFDKEDRVCGFSEPLIHTFCKNSSVIAKESQFFHEVATRTNVLLLGDSMGDIHMDVGVEKDGPTLKIGFLNSNVENLLDHYMKEYDIVLITDHTMQVPNMIIDAVVGRTSG